MKRWSILVLLIAGCGTPKPVTPVDSPKDAFGEPIQTSATSNEPLPAFSLATSEYPSWSTFIVAGKAGLINPAKGGQHGTLELKHGVDVVIEVKDYDPCLTAYSNGACDAVCMTNMDSLNPSMSRSSTAICPTSTSVGADKVIAVGIENVDQLKDVPVRGLEKSVSQYCFVRGLKTQGKNPAEYKFSNLDPAPASTALQTGSEEIKAICVWNPFALQTLRTAKGAKCIFSSDLIPGEIVDMVVVANESLAKPKGPEFATCLCDIQYEVNKRLRSVDSKVADATLTALGQDFSNLPLEDMRVVIQETSFYWTAQDGINWFRSDDFKKKMETVISTCQEIGVLEAGKMPTIGYGDSSKQLNFDAQFMEKVAD
jgi:hypothetical protein